MVRLLISTCFGALLCIGCANSTCFELVRINPVEFIEGNYVVKTTFDLGVLTPNIEYSSTETECLGYVLKAGRSYESRTLIGDTSPIDSLEFGLGDVIIASMVEEDGILSLKDTLAVTKKTGYFKFEGSQIDVNNLVVFIDKSNVKYKVAYKVVTCNK